MFCTKSVVTTESYARCSWAGSSGRYHWALQNKVSFLMAIDGSSNRDKSYLCHKLVCSVML